MRTRTETAKVQQLPLTDPERLMLDQSALDAARGNLDRGAVTPHSGPWRQDIIKLLNDSLATELVCVLRYKRHHFTAEGLASPKIAEEFLVHAGEEAGHADRLARRIVQLGGEPDFSPDSLSQRSDLVAFYSEEGNPQEMYFAHRKGWLVSAAQIKDTSYLAGLRERGCRLLFINKKMLEKGKRPRREAIYEDDNYLVFRLIDGS